jgi:hypothetical protein
VALLPPPLRERFGASRLSNALKFDRRWRLPHPWHATSSPCQLSSCRSELARFPAIWSPAQSSLRRAGPDLSIVRLIAFILPRFTRRQCAIGHKLGIQRYKDLASSQSATLFERAA